MQTDAAPLLGTGQPVFETERLVLRGFAAVDLEPFLALYADGDAARFIGGPETRAVAWRRFAACVGHVPMRGYGPFSWVRKGDGAWIGFGGPWFPEGKPGAEVMWALAPRFHGQGYAHEAASAMLDHVARDLGWRSVLSVIDPANAPSRRLAERLGAVVDGAWHGGPGGRELLLYRHDLTGRLSQNA